MYFLVDYENVHNNGLDGVQILRENDKVVVFFSQYSPQTIPFDMHVMMMSSPAKFEYRKVKHTGIANCLDFQLSTYLGFLIAEGGEREFVIVSADQGFNAVIDFWKSQKEGIKITICPKICLAQRVFEDAEDLLSKENEEILNKIKELLKSKDYGDTTLAQIFSVFRSSEYPSQLNNGIMNIFKDAKIAGELYSLLKDYFVETVGKCQNQPKIIVKSNYKPRFEALLENENLSKLQIVKLYSRFQNTSTIAEFHNSIQKFCTAECAADNTPFSSSKLYNILKPLYLEAHEIPQTKPDEAVSAVSTPATTAVTATEIPKTSPPVFLYRNKDGTTEIINPQPASNTAKSVTPTVKKPIKTAISPNKTVVVAEKTAETSNISVAVAEKNAEIPNKTIVVTEKTAETPNKPVAVAEKTAETPNKPVAVAEKTAETPNKTVAVAEKTAATPNKSVAATEKTAEIPNKTVSATEKTAEIPNKTVSATEKNAKTPNKTVSVTEKTAAAPNKPVAVTEKTAETPNKTVSATEKNAKTPNKTADVAEKTAKTPFKTSKRVPRNSKKVAETPQTTVVTTEAPIVAENDIFESYRKRIIKALENENLTFEQLNLICYIFEKSPNTFNFYSTLVRELKSKNLANKQVYPVLKPILVEYLQEKTVSV